MAGRVKTKLKPSLLVALLAASGGFFLLMGASSVSSQVHGVSSGMVAGERLYDAGIIDAFYQQREMRPVWIRGHGDFQPRAVGILSILENSWTHGLNPHQYHVEDIQKLMADKSADHDVEIDILLTDAVIRYGRDLTGMRNKKHVPYDQVVYWRQPMTPEQIMDRIATSPDPVSALRKLEPTGKLYQALRHELIALAAQDRTVHAPIKLSKAIKPGQENASIPVIRQRLNASNGVDNSKLYDDDLAARVMSLQREYRLEDNGIITQELAAILNLGPDDKIRQIVANMERLRWLDQDRPERYILVNIPSASLWAVEGAEVVLEMPVIVGKTARPTYSFKTEITGVRFNPNWTVPPTIKKADFLPMLQQDPYSLTKRGIELSYEGKTIDPGKVDWTKVGTRSIHNVKMVQGPGEENPLGKVRVIMENPYNIYLHDTNHREMFDKYDRNLSSGCIRVSQPEKLADFILSENDKWSWDSMVRMIDSGKMRDVKTDSKIPVYITYQTIWLDSEGRLIYGSDVYGQDAKLAEMLEKSGSVHIPNILKDSQISL